MLQRFQVSLAFDIDTVQTLLEDLRQVNDVRFLFPFSALLTHLICDSLTYAFSYLTVSRPFWVRFLVQYQHKDML